MRTTASASIWIKAPRSTLISILNGYQQYETWLPDVTRSRLLVREGGVSIAEFIAPVYGNEKILLEMVESPDSVIFTQVDRYREQGLSGRWRIAETERGEGVIFEATLAVTRRWPRLGCRKRLQSVLERTVSAVSDRALRLSAQGLTAGPVESRKILEITRRGERLIVRLEDEVYELARAREAAEP